MSAIIISDVTVRNEEDFLQYRTRAAKAIEAYGGRYIARGGEVQTLEGTWKPRTIVVLEFPSEERALAWYGSVEYAAALEFRDAALSRNLILVEGYQQPA